MVLKGLLVLASGFIFIFSSGIPMRMISRFRPDYKKEGMYWGIGIWIIAFFVSTFLQNFLRQIITGGQSGSSTSILPYLLGAVLTTLLLQFGMMIYLKSERKKSGDIPSTGLALGFGIGLIAQIFTGMTLIGAGGGMIFQGAGMKLAEGTVQAGTIAMISSASFFSVLVGLISLILYRVALLTISSVQGYLVAGSLQGKSSRFWSGALVSVAFTWIIFLLQLLLGTENPGQILGITSPFISIISVVYYLLAFFLGYRWLANELQASVGKKPIKRS